MKEVEEQLRVLGYDINDLYRKFGNSNPNGWQDFLYDIQQIIDDGKVKRLTITNYEKLVSKYMYDTTFVISSVDEEKDWYYIVVKPDVYDKFAVNLHRVPNEGKWYKISIWIDATKNKEEWFSSSELQTPEKIIKFIDTFISNQIVPLPF